MDKKQLEHAAEITFEFYEEYTGDGAKTKQYSAFKALASLTLNDLKNGKETVNCQYTVWQIHDEMTGTVCEPGDEKIKRTINRNLNNLTRVLPTHSDMLSALARDKNLNFIPSYNFSEGRGGGAGNKTSHSISILPAIYKKESVDTQHSFKNNNIKYFLEKIENLPSWAKWLNNFELSGKRFHYMAISVVFILFLMLLLLTVFLSNLFDFNNTSTMIKISIFFIFIELLLFGLVYPLYAAATKKVIAAPILLIPPEIVNAQLELTATDKIRESTGRYIRKFQLVSYASTCSICGSRVELEKGGKEFYNRLIGRCMEAPEEHIFSFDRVARTGFPLREYYKN